jgi:lipopolysaccharide/colanic/teichoic acid biosynthesis glycosyltransferase
VERERTLKCMRPPHAWNDTNGDQMKRAVDSVVACIGLVIACPLLIPVLAAVWVYDFHNPFFMGIRVGKDGSPFRMVKIRSMRFGAHKSGVNSTSADDARITPIGHFVRSWKLDEITQLWNVALGEMSLVGPRPQVEADVRGFTSTERHLLSVRPGITDLSSIIFADEGNILRGHDDPDLAYNQLIRPYKSRLGLLYIERRTLTIDIAIIWLTVISLFSRTRALAGVSKLLSDMDAPADLVELALRVQPLRPASPPGAENPDRFISGNK